MNKKVINNITGYRAYDYIKYAIADKRRLIDDLYLNLALERDPSEVLCEENIKRTWEKTLESCGEKFSKIKAEISVLKELQTFFEERQRIDLFNVFDPLLSPINLNWINDIATLSLEDLQVKVPSFINEVMDLEAIQIDRIRNKIEENISNALIDETCLGYVSSSDTGKKLKLYQYLLKNKDKVVNGKYPLFKYQKKKLEQVFPSFKRILIADCGYVRIEDITIDGIHGFKLTFKYYADTIMFDTTMELNKVISFDKAIEIIDEALLAKMEYVEKYDYKKFPNSEVSHPILREFILHAHKTIGLKMHDDFNIDIAILITLKTFLEDRKQYWENSNNTISLDWIDGILWNHTKELQDKVQSFKDKVEKLNNEETNE